MEVLNIQKSKLRREILKLYFSSPEERYYLRQLERILGKPVSYIRRELLKLEKSGLFLSEFSGKERYFKLNKEFPLYREMEKIVSKTIGIESLLKTALKKVKNIKTAFIFGSFAKNKTDEFSDIDILIVGSPDEDKLITAVSRIETEISREVNYHVFSPADFQKKARRKNSFICSILNNPKIFLIGDEKGLP